MKKIVLLFLIFTINSFSMTIKGDFVMGEKGEKIPLKEYKRIVVYSYGAIEILYKIGAGDRVVAIPNHKKEIWPKEKTDKLPQIGSLSKPSLESILKYNPDLVIFNVMGGIPEELERFNISSITYNVKSLEDIINNISVLGRLTSNNENSQKVINNLQKQLNKIKKQSKLKGEAIILYSASPLSSFIKNSLPVEILEELGLKVIAPKSRKGTTISPEYILKYNPDYLIGTRGIKKVEDINSIPLITETKAYKNNKVKVIDSEIIMRGSHRTFDEIEKIYKILNWHIFATKRWYYLFVKRETRDKKV